MALAIFTSDKPCNVCVIDAKGAEVFLGDEVYDSFGDVHKVAAIVAQTADQAYITDEDGVDMMPWLTERKAKHGRQ